MKIFRDIIVWQKSKSLVRYIYTITTRFPKDDLYGLISQIRRSAISIPSNIAEGYGRNSNSEFTRFLRIATGSLYELETQIDIAHDIGFIPDDTYKIFLDQATEISKMLRSFIQKLEALNTKH